MTFGNSPQAHGGMRRSLASHALAWMACCCFRSFRRLDKLERHEEKHKRKTVRFRAVALRYDIVVISATLAAFAVSRILVVRPPLSGSALSLACFLSLSVAPPHPKPTQIRSCTQGSFFVSEDDQFRIIYAIPLLRVFSIVKTTREIVFGLILSLPSVSPIFGLLAVR